MRKYTFHSDASKRRNKRMDMICNVIISFAIIGVIFTIGYIMSAIFLLLGVA